MAKQTKSTLKTFFESGDKPTQAQFEDVFDSHANLIETAHFSGSEYSGSGGSNPVLTAIIVTGSIIPEGSGSWDLGSLQNPFKDLFVTTESIHFINPKSGVRLAKFTGQQALDISEGKLGAAAKDKTGKLQFDAGMAVTGSITASGIKTTDLFIHPTGVMSGFYVSANTKLSGSHFASGSGGIYREFGNVAFGKSQADPLARVAVDGLVSASQFETPGFYINGMATGSISGSMTGSGTGSWEGDMTGSFTGSMTGSGTGSWEGNMTGSVSGSSGSFDHVNIGYQGWNLVGGNSAYLKTNLYNGFTSASSGTGPPGIIMWSGSGYFGTTDTYGGLGYEYVNSTGYVRFRTSGSEISTPRLDVKGDISASGNIYMTQTAGTDNSVVVLDSDGKLITDEIDSRVWGSTLLENSDTGSMGDLTVVGNISASGVLTAGSASFSNLPVSQSGLSDGVLYTVSGSQLPFSGSTAEMTAISNHKFVLVA